jgi:pilus assembly protein CpaC
VLINSRHRAGVAALIASAFSFYVPDALAQSPRPSLGGPSKSVVEETDTEIASVALRQIRLNVSRGQTVRLPAPAATIFVADPSIADIQTPSNRVVFVFGKKPGRTSLFALSESGDPIAEYQVVVTPPVEDLRELLHGEVPDSRIGVTYTPNGAVLSGTVPNAVAAEAARSIASQFLGQGAVVNNRLKVAGAIQVNLRVRVAEISRSVSKEFGINWNAVGQVGNFRFGLVTGRQAFNSAGQLTRSPTGAAAIGVGFSDGVNNISAVIDALAAEGLVSILAEPNLTAVSGESASFLACGEFPIPVAQGSDRVSVDFRRFGVSLEFVPTVLSGDLINVRVKPEVSELSANGAVDVSGFRIPAIATRRADTVVELASGQSFAIGGLIRRTFETDVNNVPWLGDIPILGALFRSSRFQKNESELVIIVTPYIVRASSARLKAPTDRLAPPSDVERVLYKSLARPGGKPVVKALPGPSLPGNAGFILE